VSLPAPTVDPEVRYRTRRIGAGAADHPSDSRRCSRGGGAAGDGASTTRIAPPKRPCASTSISLRGRAQSRPRLPADQRYADAGRPLEAARARYPTHPLLDFPLAAAYAELDDGTTRWMRPNRKAQNPIFDLASFGSRFQDGASARSRKAAQGRFELSRWAARETSRATRDNEEDRATVKRIRLLARCVS